MKRAIRHIQLRRSDFPVPGASPKQIPETIDHLILLRVPLARAVYYDVLYAAAYRRAPKKVGYSLFPPDPWLIAVAAVMWEGIVQGVAWDAVKASVSSLLGRLRGRGLAPVSSATMTDTATAIGFHYVNYASDGRKQRELFVGLRRVHTKSSVAERAAISASFTKAAQAQSSAQQLPKGKRRGHSSRRRT